MALAGELGKYIGGELVKNTGKEVATAGAKSALANLISDTGTKAVAKATEESILNGLVPSTARKLASGVELGSEAIPLFRGQTNRLDRLDYNKGLSPNSNGFFMTPNKGATDSWAGKGVVSVNADPNDIMTLDELRSLKKDAEKYFRDPKYQMELYNTNPTQAEIYDALEAGDSYQELSRLTKKPFIERDGGQGTELGEVVFFPDTNPELTSRYNADLASGKNQWLAPTENVVASENAVPAGTKIKFDKDLNMEQVNTVAKKYLGEPAQSPSLSPIVADENGVAKTFYHGSPSMDITDFDINMAGRNTRSGERAIWFTDDYPTAEEFSYERIPGDTLFADKRGAKGKVYERNLGLENPLDLSNLSDKQIEELYKYADSRMAFDGKDNFIRRMKEFRDAGNDQLMKSQLDMKKLSNSEYDGIVAKMYPGENEVREIGVFDPKKIKNVDSLNPANDPDIHYSEIAMANVGGLDERTKRAIEIIDQANNFGQPVENALYNKIDPSTLPKGYSELTKLLDSGTSSDNVIAKRVAEKIGTDDPTNADLDKVLDYLYVGDNREKRVFKKSLEEKIKKFERDSKALGLDIDDPRDRMTKSEMYKLFGQVWNKAKKEEIDKIIQLSDGNDIMNALMDPSRRGIRTGTAGGLDTALSERLGIAPGNTIKITSDRYSDYGSPQSAGRYHREFRDIAINPKGGIEGQVSTMAHERLHSFQNESKPNNLGRYSKEVSDAYLELQKDLAPFLKSKDEIANRYGMHKADYWASDIEQEARMLQNYLENTGITNNSLSSVASGEWGDEIKPAFDKFFEKLRELSKKGIALPAIAGLVGIGALANEKDDKSVDNIK